LASVHPADARSRLPAIGMALFGLLALGGATSREWRLLNRPRDWASVFSGPGDFAPANIVTALVHGGSVASAYGHSSQPYPLPYLLAFAPFGLLDDPWIRPAVTLFCIGLFLVSMQLLGGGWRNPGFLPALISVPLFADLLTAHATSQLGLTGLCLSAWAHARRRWVLVGVGLTIGLIRPPNALPLLAVLIYTSWGEWRGLIKAAIAGVCLMLPLVALAFWLDATWVTEYSINVAQTDYAGLPLVAIQLGGTWGLLLLQLMTVLLALYLARARRGQPLEPDLAAYVIAIGVVSSKLAGPYSGIFALPALARLGLRPKLAWTPWIASGAAWLLELAFFPGILAGKLDTPIWESVIAYWLVFAAWPLALSYPRTTLLKIGQARV
jgi:hypothetical protein